MLQCSEFSNYKSLIRAFLNENKHIRGYQSRLADAANCQKSHFSLVLNSHHHLSSEQGLLLADYWGFNSKESEYFLCLIEKEKTSSSRFLERCDSRLKALKKEMEKLGNRFKADELSKHSSYIYYSRWEYQAIHAIISTQVVKNSSEISDRLGIPNTISQKIVRDLENMGVLTRMRGTWKVTGKNIHIGDESPMNWINHHHWRQLAVEKSKNHESGEIHFSGVFALSTKDANRVKSEIYEILDRAREIAIKSKEKEVWVLTTDWYNL